METTIASGSLPALCHVVCTLVATGITGINVTSSVPGTTPASPPQPAPLPEGYVAYPDIGVAYKVYDESVNWTEAKRRCIRDGARLALIDSAKKVEYVKSQKKTLNDAHVGITRMYDAWVDDTTGKKLEALPWYSGYPRDKGDCCFVEFSVSGIWNDACSTLYNYICEIPSITFRNNAMTVN